MLDRETDKILNSSGAPIDECNEETETETNNFFNFESSRGTEIVDIDEGKYVEVAPNEEKRIATSGLATCTAIAVIADFPSGVRHGYIQHNYDARPGDIGYLDANSEATTNSARFIIPELDRLIQEKADSIKIIIVYPASLAENETANGQAYTPAYPDQLNKLGQIITEKLVDAATIKAVPYLEYTKEIEAADTDDKYCYGSNLLIDFSPDGSTAVFVNSEKIELDK